MSSNHYTDTDNNSIYNTKVFTSTMCAVLGITAGITGGLTHHLVTTADQTRYRKHFAKQLRTLRAKRLSALTRRLTRFVRQFTASKK